MDRNGSPRVPMPLMYTAFAPQHLSAPAQRSTSRPPGTQRTPDGLIELIGEHHALLQELIGRIAEHRQKPPVRRICKAWHRDSCRAGHTHAAPATRLPSTSNAAAAMVAKRICPTNPQITHPGSIVWTLSILENSQLTPGLRDAPMLRANISRKVHQLEDAAQQHWFSERSDWSVRKNQTKGEQDVLSQLRG